jgi:diacylglycerol kinase (ATP)
VSIIKKHTISFKYALSGIAYTFRTQPNFKIHTLAAITAIAASFILNISQTEKIVIVFTISLVLIAEMINTSIESVVDLLTDKFHQEAKIAKDVSAGMVLLSAIASIFIAFIIFGKYLINI